MAGMTLSSGTLSPSASLEELRDKLVSVLPALEKELAVGRDGCRVMVPISRQLAEDVRDNEFLSESIIRSNLRPAFTRCSFNHVQFRCSISFIGRQSVISRLLEGPKTREPITAYVHEGLIKCDDPDYKVQFYVSVYRGT